jgi:hypothetical protein
MASSCPPKVMDNSELIEWLARNNFAHWSNFEIDADFEIQIQQGF